MHSRLPGVTTASIKVLLVDDEPAQMELIKLNLEEADASFKITLAPTPKEALTILEKEPFDCIVSDFIIPLARKVYALHLLEEI